MASGTQHGPRCSASWETVVCPRFSVVGGEDEGGEDEGRGHRQAGDGGGGEAAHLGQVEESLRDRGAGERGGERAAQGGRAKDDRGLEPRALAAYGTRRQCAQHARSEAVVGKVE